MTNNHPKHKGAKAGAVIALALRLRPLALPLLLSGMAALVAVGCGGSNKDVSVSGVTLDKAAITLAPGGTFSLVATVSPNNATNSNVTWSTSNPSVATVSGAGSRATVAALADGEATITVRTEDGGKTATCAVTVATAVTGVTLDKGALYLSPGGSATLTATILPSTASNQQVTWTSSAPNFAGVRGDGQNATVTAFANGPATITVTTADGSKTATCDVIVSDPDPYDTEFALIRALEEFAQKVSGKVLSEQEQAVLSDELKEIFVKAYARDKYSAKLPFSSEEIKRGLSITKFTFPNVGGGDYSGFVEWGGINIGSMNSPEFFALVAIHEVGHHWGLDENLTSMLAYNYMTNERSGERDNWGYYSFFYDNLLAERVGKEKIWSFLRPTIYPDLSSSNQNTGGLIDKEYGKLWDENMIVTVNGQKSPLIDYYGFQMMRCLLFFREFGTQPSMFISGYEKFAGVNYETLNKTIYELVSVFENALKTNDATSIKLVRDFVKSIVDFRETLKDWDGDYYGNDFYQIFAPRNSFYDFIVRNHLNAIYDVKPK
jgi:hypothetical protein